MWKRSMNISECLINQNYIREEIKSTLNSVNACYHAIQYILSSHLLPKYIKIKIYKTIILPIVLYGCETWSVTLREEHRLRMFMKRVLRTVTGCWRKLHNEEFHNLYSSPNITMINSRSMK
jgi:hypothetical protein